MMKILPFLVALLAAWPAAAQLRCVILSPDSTTVVAGPMPPSASNDCKEYGGTATLITEGDSRWRAWLAQVSQRATIESYTIAIGRKLDTGITITCGCSGYLYGSLNGTYPLTDMFIRTLNGLAILAVQKRPLSAAGGATVLLRDMTGVEHSWDAAHILELAAAVTEYQLSLAPQNVQATGWPANTVTIQ